MAQGALRLDKPKQDLRLNSFSLPAEIGFHVALGLFALACIIPFVFVIIISVTSEASIAAVGYSFFPQSLSGEAYNYVLKMGQLVWRSYYNSFFVTIVGTVVSVSMCLLYAYPLFRKDYKWRGFFNFASFFVMIFGGGLVPTIIICKNILGLNENYAALIVPMLFSPFNVIIMRTFLQTSVPVELIEASTIDGAGEYRTLLQIVMPIVKPGIATVALLNALAYWNDWYLALLYLRTNTKLIPMQYLLMQIQRTADFLAANSAMMGVEGSKAAMQIPSQSLRMALVVMLVVPIACAYPFFQRYVVAGLTIGSVKG